jgi:hypothetical protein
MIVGRLVVRLSEVLEKLVSRRLTGLLAEHNLTSEMGDGSPHTPAAALTEELDNDLKLRLAREFQVKMVYGDGDDVALGAPARIVPEIAGDLSNL